jgi:predicted DNA-binding transcriptional regulator AlpA
MSASSETSLRLADLLEDPGKITDLSAEAIPGLLGELERLKALLWARLLMRPDGNDAGSLVEDRLLDVKEASGKLGISADALYRKDFPFKVKLGTRIRFSQHGIERYIKQRVGR